MFVFDDITLRMAGRTLIDGASVALPAPSRIGFVGRNGTGKTTLFRVLTGDLAPDSGTITLPARARIGKVAQEAPSGPTPIIDIVLAADEERTRLLAEAESATDPHRIADIHTRLIDIDAHSAPARAAAILAGLGFDAAAQQRPAAEFSGGWRMRVALAAVLFTEPDLLLLDEPTNYLDLEGTLWLREHLKRYPHTVLLISHDRDLLNACVEHILHLDNGQLRLWRGNYDLFARTRAEEMVLRDKAARKQEEHRKHLQAFVDRFKAKASKARQAQSRVKMLEKMESITTIVDTDVVPFHFPAPARKASPPIIHMERAAVGYEPGKPILQRLNIRVDDDDRIGLLGSNGNGKSTFLKLIAGRLDAMSGSIVKADKLKVAYFAQHQIEDLRPEESVYAHVRRLLPDAPEAKVRAAAARMGFSGERADTKVGSCSGGEKARLLLGLVTFEGPHLLILDEPTNHLDIDSREALIEALNDFAGAVMIVSHDRHLLEATVERLWLVKGGTVTPFDGDLDDYMKHVLTDSRPAPSQSQPRPVTAERTPLKALQRTVADAEAKMQRLQADIDRIDRILAQPGYFEAHPDNAAQAAKARAERAEALVVAEEEWLAASEALEAAQQPD